MENNTIFDSLKSDSDDVTMLVDGGRHGKRATSQLKVYKTPTLQSADARHIEEELNQELRQKMEKTSIAKQHKNITHHIRQGIDHSAELFLPHNLNSLLHDIIRSLKKMSESEQRFIYCEFKGQLFRVKICFYNIHVPAPAQTDKQIIHQSEMEFRALQLMKPLLDNKHLDTIVRLYHVHTIDNLAAILPNAKECRGALNKKNLNNTLCKYAHLIENGLALNKCSFLIMEECDVPLSLLLFKYIDSPANLEVLRVIMFEVIHALYVMTTYYPQMHHYDLHTNNIIMKFDRVRRFGAAAYFREFHVRKSTNRKMTNAKDKNNKNKINNRDKSNKNKNKEIIFYAPYFHMTPKIIDFEFAVIPEENIVSEATTDRFLMYQRADNDFVLTLYWMYHNLQYHNLINDAIEELFAQIEPNESYKKYEIYHLRKIEHLIPSYHEMLCCKAFAMYRKKPSSGEIIDVFAAI